MRFGSLFAGIGGFDLGFERAGMECAWQVEIDDYATKVLEKHWPNVKRYRDVREVGKHNLEPVDVICGGFPCQGISYAGKGLGLADERSGLWGEYLRIVSELRPRFVVVENPTALLDRGMGKVLGDLAACRYDTEWQSVPAASVGAPHIRDRVWILAHSRQVNGGTEGRNEAGERRPGLFPKADNGQTSEWSPHRQLIAMVPGVHPRVATDWWHNQSRMDRSVNGLSGGVDRCCSLGNAVVPQVAEWIGRRIMESVTP